MRVSPGNFLHKFKWLLLAGWTLILLIFLSWNLWQQYNETVDAARDTARTAFDKDLVYRRWAALNGGVYVPATENTPPNPYLSHLPNRDITTETGQLLTLINPAYMTRQVMELGWKEYRHRGHITSLTPLRPENAPDPWEKKALESFKHGPVEITSLEDMDGQEHMRLMRPLRTEKACLKCHAEQGYKEGDIRGGISVSVPMEPLWEVARSQNYLLLFGTGGIWALGLAGIGLGARSLKKSIKEQEDTTESLRKSREELVRAKEAAEAASKTKSEFLANMSHEIRTPLNGILGTLQLMEDGPLDAEHKEYVKIAYQSGTRLLSILNDILDLSKVEAGKLKIVVEEINLPEIMRSAADMFQQQADAKGLVLECDMEGLPPWPLLGDTGRIRQILFNLMGNAVKFTEQGEVRLTARQADEQPRTDRTRVLFIVSDTGVGIPPQHIETIFEPFVQADGSSTRKYQGTGLGLAIVRRLLDLMEGMIEIESRQGAGTTMIFSIDFKRPTTP